MCTTSYRAREKPYWDGEGHEKRQTPERGDLSKVVVPEMRQGQGEDGDGQQHAGKGDDPGHAEILADGLGLMVQAPMFAMSGICSRRGVIARDLLAVGSGRGLIGRGEAHNGQGRDGK